jgi:membrane associated rhomboid family serine protease
MIFVYSFIVFYYFCRKIYKYNLNMFRNLPTITKNLLLINVVCFFADLTMKRYGIDLVNILGLHYITSDGFRLWQPLTYMFMHAGWKHLFFNMFAVLMFAPALESRWGEKRFLIYYLITGLGAAVVQEAVWALQLHNWLNGGSAMVAMRAMAWANNAITIGASGAVFGILLAFGWLFPDVRMFLLFVPIPIRARTLVIIYALVELFAGLAPISGDNVAHFAHLGGMVFGLLLILWWRHRGYDGFDSISHEPSRLKRWLDEQKEKWRAKRPPRIRRDKDSKDYSDYHYHKPL